ncbi:MAG: cytochrome c oxidase subunit 3 [Jatrophihabitans sp.]
MTNIETAVTIGDPDLHLEDPNVIGRRWRAGVALLILADAAFVATLLFAYFYLRGLNTSNAWLLHGQATAAIWVSWALAGGAVLSAVIFGQARRSIQAGNEAGFVAGALVALLVLVADTVGQVIQLTSFPFGVASSAYSSVVYTIAGANLYHLLLTIFIAIAMWNRGRLHIYSKSSNWQVRVAEMWWNWIAIAAVLTAFATSFIASPASGH